MDSAMEVVAASDSGFGVLAFQIIMTTITPIILAIFAFIQKKHDVNADKYRKLREEQDKILMEQRELEEQKKEKMIKDIWQTVETLKSELSIFRNEVLEMNIDRKISDLFFSVDFNFKYIHVIGDILNKLTQQCKEDHPETNDEMNEYMYKFKKISDNISSEMMKRNSK